MGKSKRPYFRIVVLDSRSKRDGDYIECLGYYHPIEDSKVKIDLEKYNEWIFKGAQPSLIVKNLVKKIKKNKV